MKIRLLPTAVLAVVLTLSAFISGKAEAITVSSLTVTFSGLVTAITDPGSVTGLHSGDAVSAALTFTPVVNSYDETTSTAPTGIFGAPVTTTLHTFTETGSFTFGKTGDSPFQVTGASGTVQHSKDDFLGQAALSVALANGGDSISLGTNTIFSNAALLTSLAQLPTDANAFSAFLNGIPNFTSGTINYQGAQISLAGPPPITFTPIPATLPLLASGLCALGFVGWRRRAALSA